MTPEIKIVAEHEDYTLFDYVANGESCLMWDAEEQSWFLDGWLSLSEAAKRCNIPPEVATIMALKYGK